MAQDSNALTPQRLNAVVCLGEALVDFVADVADVSLIECPGFRKAPGGAPANVAVGLARLGVPAAFLGKVGDDPFGHFLEQTFSGAGVDTRHMRFDTEARTGLAFVSLRANGERDFLFYRNPSADMLYRADEIPDEALAGCRVFHFGSLSLIQEPSRGATLDAARRAREAGALISYDPNLRPPLWPDLDTARREILAALPLADVVKVSEEEAAFLGASLFQGHVRLVAATRGEGGCSLRLRDGPAVEVPGYRVAVVDTTGAGDGFTAGMLAGLLDRGGLDGLEPVDLERLGRCANAVGALTCRTRGAIPALPNRAEVEALLRSASG
jgi:fructokinase